MLDLEIDGLLAWIEIGFKTLVRQTKLRSLATGGSLQLSYSSSGDHRLGNETCEGELGLSPDEIRRFSGRHLE